MNESDIYSTELEVTTEVSQNFMMRLELWVFIGFRSEARTLNSSIV
jgi:hypothetical protein